MKSHLTAIAIALAMTASASAADWGSLKGCFVFDGDVVAPQAIEVTKDVEFCKGLKLVNEELVVSKAGGLANVVVYVYLKRGKTIDIHPDLKEVGEEPAVLDYKACRFEPHVLFVRTNQSLELQKSDEIGHSVVINTMRNSRSSDVVSPIGTNVVKKFEKSEPYPLLVNCSVHPWMNAHIVVRDNPYVAISATDGSFEIKDLPVGEHEFIFWHEAKGMLPQLEVGKTKTNRKGRATLTIAAAKTIDLGEIKVPAEMLGQR